MSFGFSPPPVTRDLNIWAQNIVAYLRRTASRLQFKPTGAPAVEDGVILWDAAEGYPVVSKGDGWRQIVLADGYAQLIQDADITAAAADTAYAITYDTPALAGGISLGTPASRIVFAEGGTYWLTFTAQTSSTSSSTVTFRFWPRINGVDVPGSTITSRLHSNDASTVVSRAAVFQMSAGDYLEVMWEVSATQGYLHAFAASANAPASPSTTLSITRLRA